MKDKKQNFWNSRERAFLSALFIFIVLTFFLYNFFNSDKYFCSQNPDKCVCEEYKMSWDFKGERYTDYIPFEYLEINKKERRDQDVEFICSKFRKKTQAELDIDDCNNNPREDELCKCEEYKNYNQTGTWQSCNEYICIKGISFYENGQHKQIKNMNIPCLKSQPKTEFELNPEQYQCNKWMVYFYEGYKNSSSYGYKENHQYIYTNEALKTITYQEVLDDIKSKECIEWRNKTDWEKHPEDYMAETKCKTIKKACNEFGCGEGDSEYWNVEDFTLGNQDMVVVENETSCETTYRLKNECEKGNPNWIEEEKCVFDETYAQSIDGYETIKKYANSKNILMCTSFKTICREKTEAEKLMDKDCESLLYTINYYSSKYDFSLCGNKQYFFKPQPNKNTCSIYLNTKQAFRNKGCQI